MTHDWARREIGKTAKAMLSGVTSFIEGARTLAGLRFSAGLERDPDLTVFVAIDSETDALPMGDVRKLWNPDALAKLQPEIDRAEAWAREGGLEACERLAQRFGGSA
jgi:hypothetical protein